MKILSKTIVPGLIKRLRRGLGDKKGFTLVELIVVIGILVVLISLITPQAISYVKKANEVACSANMNTLIQEYTAKALWRYSINRVDAQMILVDVAEAHGEEFVPFTGGMHNGEIAGVCPSGGVYVCDFSKDNLIVIMNCSEHGMVKLDVVQLYDHLSGLKFDKSSGFPYGSVDEYFRNNYQINSDAINTSAAYKPYSSMAEAVEVELKKQGVDVTNRTWRLYKRNNEYNMFLAETRLTKEQKGEWIRVEKYEMNYVNEDGSRGRVVVGYAPVITEGRGANEYPKIDGGNFRVTKPAGFKG